DCDTLFRLAADELKQPDPLAHALDANVVRRGLHSHGRGRETARLSNSWVASSPLRPTLRTIPRNGKSLRRCARWWTRPLACQRSWVRQNVGWMPSTTMCKGN